MNTRYLMISSSIVTGFPGLVASFMPDEILRYIGVAPATIPVLLVQVLGALYLGFAVMNWMAKSVLVGGIYAGPLATGNCVHFTVAALALLKSAVAHPTLIVVWGLTTLYTVFAILFILVLFMSPKKALAKNI